MTTFDETNEPVENKSGAEPNFGSSDDDLAMFALPARTSSSDIQNLVRRHPLVSLIAAVWLGVGIGKLTRLI
jgi:hypothetical protein